MRGLRRAGFAGALAAGMMLAWQTAATAQETVLPAGVKVEWDLAKAKRDATSTSERICLDGLWRFQPAKVVTETAPTEGWGYIKTPGAWTASSSQTLYANPGWVEKNAGNVTVAWYQREIAIPANWAGRRIAVTTEYLNSYTAVYVDGKKAGEMYFPWGEVDVTEMCKPGQKVTLSLCVQAAPLAEVIKAFTDTAGPKDVKASVRLRGLCGDVYLAGTPKGARIDEARVETSVRKWEIAFNVKLNGLEAAKKYTLQARVTEQGRPVKDFASGEFSGADVKEGRYTFKGSWKPEKLWDTHTPGNRYDAAVTLMEAGGGVADAFRPVRFGFREFWIEGRDFYLNGKRLYCFIVPIDNSLGGGRDGTYEASRETMEHYKSFGVNLVYTHNYGCDPGAHASFDEMLRAADDTGMLIAFSQPHCMSYKWTGEDAVKTNGYARHAEFYAHVALNHPAVVMYSMSHNALSYHGAFDPDQMDGVHNQDLVIGPRTDFAAKQGAMAQAIVEGLDRTRLVYHHSSGNMGNAHTDNVYLDFTPIQERCDWFEHWATAGVKPLMLVEYGAPWGINWTMYRGWYKGVRNFGGAKVPWEFTAGEWNSQFIGDRAFNLGEPEKVNLRFEAKKWLAGEEWYRWDYPYQPVASRSPGLVNNDEVWWMFMTDMTRAFRTIGVSAFNYWSTSQFWAAKSPGASTERVPTRAAEALLRNNMPLLAYIGDRAEHVTGKGHNYLPGEVAQKLAVVINNSRETVTCECTWSLGGFPAIGGVKKARIETGNQARIPMNFALPERVKPGSYELKMSAKFSTGEVQKDSFMIDVVAPAQIVTRREGTASATGTGLWDPKGETAMMLDEMGVKYETVGANADLAGIGTLIVGKGALTVDGAAPDITKVRHGLKVIMFEQSAEVLEKRFGLRVQEYGLRNVFARVPDHPLLAGLGTENLHDWHGEATLTPARLTNYVLRPRYGPMVDWCGIPQTRSYRAGNRGNVASVIIEKPARGNFLPIVDGGYSLQFSPLMEYREGKGLLILCELDVTGRTEEDPAAKRIVANILNYTASFTPATERSVVYAGDEPGRKHLEAMGLKVQAYDGKGMQAEDVLVVGAGGAKALGASADMVKGWAKRGGRVLGIGLGAQEANMFLPMTIETQAGEYISTVFEPAGAKSALAGVGPADVMNRDPRKVELLTGGVKPVGNGVIGVSKEGNVVLSQLAPWAFDYQKYYNQKRTFRRTSYLVTRVLGNMGAAEPTPMLERFGSPVKPGAGEPRWAQGFYMEKPEEFDDPYRYFCW